MSALVEVTDLEVAYRLGRRGTIRAVDGVTLTLNRGETFGLVGESGCGKSTLGRAVLRLVEPAAGRVVVDGVDLATLKPAELRRHRRTMQMVFQDPFASLNPRQSVGRMLAETLRCHRLPSGDREIVDLLERVGLPADARERYPHEFSGGQRQRIGLARALAPRPTLVVADEPVSALDVSIQAQILNLLMRMQDEADLTYLFISHDLSVVSHVCDRVGVMYLGRLAEVAPADDLYARPLHPYTKALLSAVPVPDPRIEATRERILLGGDAPSAAAPPPGCRFHPRCPYAQERRCPDEVPALRELGSGHAVTAPVQLLPGPGRTYAASQHLVACHYAEDIEAGRLQPLAGAVRG